MRRASQNVEIVNNNGNIAISFGHDYCSEHEWGIKGIQNTFGVSGDREDLTIGRLAVTRADPASLHLIEAKDRDGEGRLYLMGGERFVRQAPAEYVATSRETGGFRGEPSAAWDESEFLFSLPIGHKRERNLRSMHKAILACDALIYRGGASFLGGASLIIARRSTLPHDVVAKMQEAFVDRKRLEEASEATGIRQRVEAWGDERARQRGDRWGGRPFYALSPRWTYKSERSKTKYPVTYWLNPTEQDRNNYGSFTVEELEQWMEGKGPIPMTAEQRRKRA